MTGKLLTITEAADRLGIHYQTLRAWADTGRVPVVKHASGHRRFESAVIEEVRREMGFEPSDPEELPPKKTAGRPRKPAPPGAAAPREEGGR